MPVVEGHLELALEGPRLEEHAHALDVARPRAVVQQRVARVDVDVAEVDDALAGAVGTVAPEATVDLNGAQAAVVVDVIKTTCSLAVLPRWSEFCGYNLRAAAERATSKSE